MVILKFGGSSVAHSAAIDRVATIVARERRPQGVVVSALAGVTDVLIEIGRLAERGNPARALEGIPLHLVVHAPGACHLAVVVAERRVVRAMSQLHARFFEHERSGVGVGTGRDSTGHGGEAAGAAIRTGLTAASQEIWA
ncbi:MAG: hypothetical protein NT151_02930 [Acidobacteria bacterium]|nr:hypothetical protein [Acidobacteriota bacterium]